MMILRQENQKLIAENRRFRDRIAVLEPELRQAKKELDEANDFLIEMRIELNNWKADILGFRDEIRNADKAQLEALLRILEVLGGEVKLASNEAEETDVSTE
jgi:predicted  nucleic acid-binding Zn-ribbon protein